MPKPKYTALGKLAVIIGAFVTGVGAFVSGVGLILAHGAGAIIEFVEMLCEYLEPKISKLFVIEDDVSEWHQIYIDEDPGWEEWHKEYETLDGPAMLKVWRSMDGVFVTSSTLIATGARRFRFLTAKNIDDAKIEAEEHWSCCKRP